MPRTVRQIAIVSMPSIGRDTARRRCTDILIMADWYARFDEKFTVDPGTGCWLWTAFTNPKGYSRFLLHGKSELAHRVSYERHIGLIPEGLELDHLCRVPGCVNPDHLEAVTHKENVRRGNSVKVKRAKTHCPKGHLYDAENTYIDEKGHRSCIICRRTRSREWYSRVSNCSS